MTSPVVTAQPGTVSAGTLNTNDLLTAFVDALESLVHDNAAHWCGNQATRDAHVALVWDARGMSAETCDDEDLQYVVERLVSALDYYAPQGTSFQAHEGDGSDFGFWAVDGGESESTPTAAGTATGYTHCPCRDCFNISIDDNMCHACVDAGCDGGGECHAEGAYGGDEIESTPTAAGTDTLPVLLCQFCVQAHSYGDYAAASQYAGQEVATRKGLARLLGQYAQLTLDHAHDYSDHGTCNACGLQCERVRYAGWPKGGESEQADLQVPAETAAGFQCGDYVTFVPRCDVSRVYLDRAGYATSRGQVGGEAGRYFGNGCERPVWAVDCRFTGERRFVRAANLANAKTHALATQPRHAARVTHCQSARTRTMTIRLASTGELLVVMKASCEPGTCRDYIRTEAVQRSR